MGRYLSRPESAAAGKPQPEPQDSARTGGKPRALLDVARQLWEAAGDGSPGPGPAPLPFLISLVVFFEAPPPNVALKPCASPVFHPGRGMTSRPAAATAASPLRAVGRVLTPRAVGGWGCGVDASGICGAGAGRTGPGEKGGARASEGRAAAALCPAAREPWERRGLRSPVGSRRPPLPRVLSLCKADQFVLIRCSFPQTLIPSISAP